MRLIDANYLDSAMYDECSHGFHLDYSTISGIISDSPTVMQWVSIEREKPPSGKLIIVYYATGNNCHIFDSGIIDSRGCWCGSGDFDGHNFDKTKFTHWIESPPPPKEMGWHG